MFVETTVKWKGDIFWTAVYVTAKAISITERIVWLLLYMKCRYYAMQDY